MKQLLQAVYAKFSSSNMSLYLQEAPPQATLPYCVFYVINSNVSERLFSSALEECELQFSVWSTTAAKSLELGEEISNLYNECEISLSGSQFLQMRRTGTRLFKDEDSWHCVVEFDVLTNKE